MQLLCLLCCVCETNCQTYNSALHIRAWCVWMSLHQRLRHQSVCPDINYQSFVCYTCLHIAVDCLVKCMRRITCSSSNQLFLCMVQHITFVCTISKVKYITVIVYALCDMYLLRGSSSCMCNSEDILNEPVILFWNRIRHAVTQIKPRSIEVLCQTIVVVPVMLGSSYFGF